MGRHGSKSASTVLPKSVGFFIINLECWTRLASHIHYIMETDLDEMIRRFARLHERDWPISRNPGKETLGRPGLKSIKTPGGARVSAVLFSPTILDAFYSFYKKVWLFPGGDLESLL